MRWDIVTFSLGFNIEPSSIDSDIRHFQNIAFPNCEEILVVNDASEDIGSCGSALNALIRTAERLCYRNNLTVLTESVLQDVNVLIVLVSDPRTLQNAKDNSTIKGGNGYVFDTYLSNSVKNCSKIAANSTHTGVWIVGSDASWKLEKELNMFDLPQDSITGFTFLEKKNQLDHHGWYIVDKDNKLSGMEFDGEYAGKHFEESSHVILGFIYLPLNAATLFLSLYSEFPVAATTYLGVDSNVTPLKLSLFFDFFLATCTSEEEFIKNKLGIHEKVSENVQDRTNARKQIFKKFQDFKGRVEVLDIIEYQYKKFPEHSRNYRQLLDIFSGELNSNEDSERVIRSMLSICNLIDMDSKTAISNILKLLRDQILKTSTPELHLQIIFIASLALSIASDGKGGLRNGPAKNPLFEKLMNGSNRQKDFLNVFDEILKNWVSEPGHMIRAARHLETSAQKCIREMTDELCLSRSLKIGRQPHASPSTVIVTAPVRIDFFGGWLDTPPIFFSMDNAAVVNMAIKLDGKNPIRCFIEKIDKPFIEIVQDGLFVHIKSDNDLIYRHDKPSEAGSLVCACIVSLGFTNILDIFEKLQCCGLRINTSSDLPHGSGLGTSSIMACTILRAICAMGSVADNTYSLPHQIVHTVLRVEQIMTTGGGWQDQCGAIYEGIKKCYYERNHGIVHSPITISSEVRELLERRLLLVYTGKTRLAKNLLQEVIRNFFTCKETKQKLKKMAEAVDKFAKQIEKGELSVELLEHYYTTKNFMTRCEPPNVTELLEMLKRKKLIEVGWAAGAGGGGFIYLWISETTSPSDIENFLPSNPQFSNMTCHRITIPLETPFILELTM